MIYSRFACAVVAAAALPLFAQVRLADPFADGAVLQREKPVPVWGVAAAGEEVTVSFAGQVKRATADAAGKWRVTLEPMAASKEGRELKAATSAACLGIRDVLVGEVWFASGQSNMDVPLYNAGCGNPHYRARDGYQLAQVVSKPTVRFLNSSCWKTDLPPQPDVYQGAKWHRFEPAFLTNKCVSAVAFHFACTVSDALDVPIGILGAYCGGSSINLWMNDAMWAAVPKSSQTDRGCVRGGLWNSSVAPLVPYALRGVLWYQGCADGYCNGHATPRDIDAYADKLGAFRAGLETSFANPELGFYLVQLCWFPGISRVQAEYAAKTPRTHLVVTKDVGNANDIHPLDKSSVGLRLAGQALKYEYGFSHLHVDSPTVTMAILSGTNVVLRLREGGEHPYLYNPDFKTDAPFELAGADGAWHPASLVNLMRRPDGGSNGVLAGRDLVIAAPDVAKPVRVRYLPEFKPYSPVFSQYDLPLGPFETKVVEFARSVKEPVKIILDSDMHGDFDDVGALAILHKYADAGFAEILGTFSCGAFGRSVPVIETLNRYYGRADLPVAASRQINPNAKLLPGFGLFPKYDGWYRHADAKDAPDAVAEYRRILAAQPDKSVTICTIGELTNLANLLKADPDVVARKVKRLVAMACRHPEGKEANSKGDVAASRAVFTNWPTPIEFTDYNFGCNVYSGRAVAESDPSGMNPVRDAFANNLMPRSECTRFSWDRIEGHPSWDETAVMLAVFGLEAEGLWNVRRGRYEMVGDDGTNRWTDDPNGPHARIVEGKMSFSQIGEAIDEIMTLPPAALPRD